MKFKLIAGTDVGLRDNNEDNFIVAPNLSVGEWITPIDSKQEYNLESKGAIMVVADGMGGQDSGEVASAIAISTIQDLFSKENLTDEVVKSDKSIKTYLKKAVIEADKRVKHRSKIDPSTGNMGSTIVIAWFINNAVYIAWLGDSRAYSYTGKNGLRRLSKDHSFVQQLVDDGKLTETEAMSHPDSNIITRSLGDPESKARPDIVVHYLQKDEIILLCSDGLCGFTDDKSIFDVLKSNEDNLLECKNSLIAETLKKGSDDNITLALFKATDDVPYRESLKGKLLLRYVSVSFFLVLLICFVVSLWWHVRVSEDDTSSKALGTFDATMPDSAKGTGLISNDSNSVLKYNDSSKVDIINHGGNNTKIVVNPARNTKMKNTEKSKDTVRRLNITGTLQPLIITGANDSVD